MTNTNTAAALSAVAVLEHHDPHSIIIEANVRPSAPLTPEWIANLKQHGVLQPVLAHRDENGNIIMRAGQRRTLGAREAGLATIPVYITAAGDTTAERIIQQIIENDHREALTDADRAAAYQQLAFEGLSVTSIAKKLGTQKTTIETGIAVANNGLAAAAITDHALTLDQAAALIEFEADAETIAELIDVASEDPNQFPHYVQRARDEARRTEIRQAAAIDLAAQGFEILSARPSYYQPTHTELRELRTAEGERVTPELIADTEGRAAFIEVYGDSTEARIIYYLQDPKAAGFKHDTGSGSTGGPMTDEQKAERKTLIANNKDWASAESVRREFLATMLSRKTLPKDSARFVAESLTTHSATVGAAVSRGNDLAHTLLGIESSGRWNGDKLAALVAKTPTKANLVTLAVILGGIEESTSREDWRRGNPTVAAYFAQLAAWSYTLSPVEQIVIDVQTARNTKRLAAAEEEAQKDTDNA